jgi:hypothetical protein
VKTERDGKNAGDRVRAVWVLLADGAEVFEESAMARTIGILLILAGLVALLYGGFGYQRDLHTVTLGPHVTLVDNQQMPVAPLAGAIALGAGLLFFVLSIPRPRARINS